MTLNMQPYDQLIQQKEYARMPWKNGLGETLEIYRLEDADGLRFRISQAAVVEDGKFSNFSGLDRTLVLLSGNGMTLYHNKDSVNQSKHTLLSPLDMARFSGRDKTTATLMNGRIEDLNIMVRELDTKAQAMACFANQGDTIVINDNSLLSGFYANESCQMILNGEDQVTLEANSFLIFKQQNTFSLNKGKGVFVETLLSEMPK